MSLEGKCFSSSPKYPPEEVERTWHSTSMECTTVNELSFQFSCNYHILLVGPEFSEPPDLQTEPG